MSAVSFLPTIDLPWPILAHAVGLMLISLNLTFRPSPPGRSSEVSTMLGIAGLGLGFSYLSTAYVPREKNAFLYASVPVRMILGGVAGVKLLVGRKGMSAEGKKELWTVMLYDGIAGLILGWYLGRWDGKIPGY